MRAEGEGAAAAPSWRQRWCAAGLLLLTMTGAAATVVVWRADAAAQRGDFARALWWRPGVPMYQRQLAESLLFTDPVAAETHLLRALRSNPYDAAALADLNTVELALGRWPRALAITAAETSQQQLSFAARWRLANLYLAHADLPGFWQQMTLAARTAPPAAFLPMSSRALTASDYDFAALRRSLPAASIAAAAAFAEAAVERGHQDACRDAAEWLLSLHPALDTEDAATRRRALLQLLTADWQHWPAAVGKMEAQLAAAAVLPAARPSPPPGLLDGDFDPRYESALRRLSPNAGAELSAILGWRWPDFPGLDAHQVTTGDSSHPTAAYLSFDGSEHDQGLAAEQWLLARGGADLSASLWTRRLDDAASGGLNLRLTRLDGAVIAETPLFPGDAWQQATAQWKLPGQDIETLRLQIVY
ncbi:MAG TPA: hypothetical protein VFP94_08425, partial [Terriglobales bacterium]|nr:hypothetical protein [Terriglobales bacterium]